MALFILLRLRLPAGVYLKDFVFLNDGHPTRLSNGLINFTKLRTICMKVGSSMRSSDTHATHCACSVQVLSCDVM